MHIDTALPQVSPLGGGGEWEEVKATIDIQCSLQAHLGEEKSEPGNDCVCICQPLPTKDGFTQK